MPVFAFGSPKDKNHHVALAGGRMGKKKIERKKPQQHKKTPENYFTFLLRAK